MNDTTVHRQTWDQIPWIVNGTLPESARLSVQAHLENCPDCREELEFQQRLAAAIESGSSISESDSQQSWQVLRARIDSAGRSGRPRQGQRRTRGLSGEWIPWLVAAMVVQAIGLGALGSVLWSKPSASSGSVYRTLSAPTSPPGNATIRVVFAPDMSVGNLQAVLAAAGLQVQSGPSSAGVWSLEPAHDSDRSATQVALRELRDSPQVRFAEVIGGSPRD
jgi:anti-sigma factor RsiW